MIKKQIFTKRIWGWATYDFANTIFAAIVLTAYFPLYLTEISGKNIQLGFVTSGSMIAAAFIIPLFGALSDKTGKTKYYLLRTTLAAVFFMALLSITDYVPLLMLSAFLACFFYHASLVFYNSLLPVAAEKNEQGLVSGLGTGLGYLGVVLVLPLAHAVDQGLGRQAVFAISACLFLLFSLPLFLFVPERRIPHASKSKWHLWKTEWQTLFTTLRSLPQNPALLLFLGGNFFVVDALNSMIFWFMVYARDVFNPAQTDLIFILAGVNMAAFAAGIFAGLLTDRFGGHLTMILSAITLLLSLLLLSWAPTFTVFSVVSMTGGSFAIAGIWTSGRKALIDLVPKEKIGVYFGLYGLTTKISVVGSLMFSIISDTYGHRHALWALIFPATVGLGMLIFSKALKGTNR